MEYIIATLLSGLINSSIENKRIARNDALRKKELEQLEENLAFQKESYRNQLAQARGEYALQGFAPINPAELNYWR